MTSHAITLDDGTTFSCGEGDTLLRSALRDGVALSYECNSGGCGTCKYTLLKGEVHQLDPDAPGLSARDRRKGKMLACQSIPLTDCAVSVQRAPGWTTGHPIPRSRAAWVKQVRDLTPDLRELTLYSDEPAEFLAGQFAMLTARGAPTHRGSRHDEPRTLERAYSMSNLPNEHGVWQFCVKRMSDDGLSRLLAGGVDIGDEVVIDGPYGHAHLRDSNRDVLVVAGGSGLAPMVSVLRGLARRPDAGERQVAFCYGGRTPVDMCVSEFVDEVRDQLADIELVEAVSAEPDSGGDGWNGARGFIHTLIDHDTVSGLADREIYVAGPPVMTDAVVRRLILDLGISADQIHYDRFF